MYTKYLVTGATGFLGRAVLNELHERTEKNTVIRALVLENDPFADGLSPKTETVCGDVAEDAILKARRFFLRRRRADLRHTLRGYRLDSVGPRRKTVQRKCQRDKQHCLAM